MSDTNIYIIEGLIFKKDWTFYSNYIASIIEKYNVMHGIETLTDYKLGFEAGYEYKTFDVLFKNYKVYIYLSENICTINYMIRYNNNSSETIKRKETRVNNINDIFTFLDSMFKIDIPFFKNINRQYTIRKI